VPKQRSLQYWLIVTGCAGVIISLILAIVPFQQLLHHAMPADETSPPVRYTEYAIFVFAVSFLLLAIGVMVHICRCGAPPVTRLLLRFSTALFSGLVMAVATRMILGKASHWLPEIVGVGFALWSIVLSRPVSQTVSD
jgi:hypothetical protein